MSFHLCGVKQLLLFLFILPGINAPAQHKATMKTIAADIIIEAKPETIWNILTDFNAYADWNPFIVSSSGKAAQGTRITNKMKQGEKIYTFRPKLTIVDHNKKLEWLGRLILPGIFDGRHSFVLENLGDGRVRLTQGEQFSGIFSGMIMKKIGAQTLQGFRAMNEALKARAEAR